MLEIGTQPWLRFIAQVIGEENVLGIELYDNRGTTVDIIPRLRIAFIVPFNTRYAQPGVAACSKIPGYHGVTAGSRGNNSSTLVGFVDFWLYDDAEIDREDIIQVANELGLNVEKQYLNDATSFARTSPKLYQ